MGPLARLDRMPLASENKIKKKMNEKTKHNKTNVRYLLQSNDIFIAKNILLSSRLIS